MKRLNELVECEYDIPIENVVSDSRYVKEGSLFVAIRGFYADRYDYIPEAVKNGAAAVVSDRDIDISVPLVIVDDINKKHLEILSNFYGNPDRKMKFLGITGTDGKTTTATILWKLFEKFLSCGYMGTNGACFKDEKHKLTNTTPVPEEMYEALNYLANKSCEVVSMELSSEGLMHGRCDNLELEYAIITNISEDHLNVHGTLENYINAKKKIFERLKEDGKAIVNRDDEHYYEIIKDCKNKVYTYGVNEESDFCIKNVKQCKLMSIFDLVYNNKIYSFESPYFGMYNVYNVTAAIIPLLLSGYSYEDIKNNLKSLEPILGRGEVLDFGQNFQVVLDYAHTSNGIKNVLSAIVKQKHNKIITITGSAGGREKEKRKTMGKHVLENSDLVIFTMDDPRYENVDDIIDDLIGESKCTNYIRIIDRKEAIFHALSIAEKDDIVLILGKGRDNYMAIEDKRIPYCDYDVICEYFNNETKN